MLFDVFLSHDRQDYDIVYRVWKILDRIKISAYMYELYPNYGQYLPETIKQVMKQSRYVVVFFTRNGINSQWVNQEVGIAIGAAGAFQSITIPILEEGVDCKGFTEHLIHIDYKTYQPDDMISNLLWTLRQKLNKANAIRQGVRIDCICGNTTYGELDSLDTINHSVDIGEKIARYECPHCGEENRFDLRTWEPVL